MKSIVLLLLVSAVLRAQDTVPVSDTAKIYSSVGIVPGDTLRLNVVNISGTNGTPPDPCMVQMGFTDLAGVVVKSSSALVDPGHTAFLSLTFGEASAGATALAATSRINLRPVLNTFAPPCRIVSTAEVINGLTNRTYSYAVPGTIPPGPPTTNTLPPGPPIFGAVQVAVGEVVRLNVTNFSGEGGTPPDPCNVQLGFVDAAGNSLKSVSGVVAPGHTAFLTMSFIEALGGPATLALARATVRPVIRTSPPDPCRVWGSSEVVDNVTSRTAVYVVPADRAPVAAPVSTTGQ